MIPPQEIVRRLERISDAPHFESESNLLRNALVATNAGIEAVGAILEFMEAHPDIDYGLPGPLTHFVERFSGAGYEELLSHSVRNQPTPQTVIMLSRVLGAATTTVERERCLTVLRDALRRCAPNSDLSVLISHFLDPHEPT